MRPRLTIAIPTYNRAGKLKSCLKRVIEYSKNYYVDLLVSDNASTDNTAEVVLEIQKEHPKIQYFRNDENLGFDGNFLNCLERANGEYVWLLSDDDVLLPGAIESILEGLSMGPVCMHLNSSGIRNEESLKTGVPRFKEEGFAILSDKNTFIERIGIHCTFVSSLVFNVDLVRRIDNKEIYFRTNILQSHILLETMKNDGLYIIDTFNCIAARGNKTVSYDILHTWVKCYSDLLLLTAPKCGFDKQRMSEVLRIGLTTTVYGFVLQYRQTCENEKAWDRECIWPYIERYPELVKRYKKAVDCPIWMLKWLRLACLIKEKVRRIYGKQ